MFALSFSLSLECSPGYLHGSLSQLLSFLLTCCLLTEAFPNSPTQLLLLMVLILFSFPPEHFSYIMHFSYSFCLLSVSPQGIWPIEDRHFSEFYLPHVHTEQCLAQSWCLKLRIEQVSGRPWYGVRRATPVGFLLNQRYSLETHKAFSFICTVYFKNVLVTDH